MQSTEGQEKYFKWLKRHNVIHRRLEQVPKGVVQKQTKGFKNYGMQKSKLKTCFPKLQKPKHVFLKINYPKRKNQVIENYIKNTSEKQI